MADFCRILKNGNTLSDMEKKPAIQIQLDNRKTYTAALDGDISNHKIYDVMS